MTFLRAKHARAAEFALKRAMSLCISSAALANLALLEADAEAVAAAVCVLRRLGARLAREARAAAVALAGVPDSQIILADRAPALATVALLAALATARPVSPSLSTAQSFWYQNWL